MTEAGNGALTPPKLLGFEEKSGLAAFRDYYRGRNRTVTRIGLISAIVLVAALCYVDAQVLTPERAERVIPLRIGLMLAPLLLALAVSFIPPLHRHVESAVTIAAMLAGLGTFSDSIVSTVLDEPVVLWGNIFFSFYIYLLLGLPFRHSVIAGSPILLLTIGLGLLYSSPPTKMIYILFAHLVGMYTSYRLEQDAREIWQYTQKLEAMSHIDALTGIANRRLFDSYYERAWRQACRNDEHIGLLLADIDHFKSCNDSLGHDAGDQCIRTVAQALAETVRRPLDLVARFGGEEFVIILYAPSRQFLIEYAHDLVQRIRALPVPELAGADRDHLTISIGAGCFRAKSTRSAAEALKQVDEALYAAKDQGRDRVEFVEEEALGTPRALAG